MRCPYADIFAFSDYRAFLTDYFQARARKEPTFTQSFICRKLGLPNSRSYFGDIVRGQKPLTPQKTEALIGVLELSGGEARYFRTLVLHNQSTLPSEREYHLEQLIAFNRSPAAQVDKGAFEYYRSYHHSIVRALLDFVDIGRNLAPLLKVVYPPLTPGKIKESFALLKRLGLIRKNPSGYWKPSEKSIHSGAYMQDEIIKQYQSKCLEVAKAALFNQKTRAQNMSTETISVSEKGYREIEQKLQKFKTDIRSLVHNDELRADRVYQLNIQLFPQSK